MPTEFGRNFKRDASPGEVSACGRRRQPVPRRDDQAVRHGRESASSPTRNPTSTPGVRSPASAAARYPDPLPLQPEFESVYAIVPSIPPILLILIPAILMAVSVVREKELGSIINFYVTPTTRLEFLLGKQLPYIAIGMINYVDPDAHGDRRLRGAAQGERPDADALRPAVRDGDHGHRPAGLDLHAPARWPRSSSRRSSPSCRRPSSPGCSSRSRPWKGGPASSARSGRPPTTCTPASGPSPRAWARGLLAVDVLALAAFIPVLIVLTAVAGLKRQES